METILQNNEALESKHRFKNMFDLHSKFVTQSQKADNKKTERENYVKCYNRWPYVKKGGKQDANFGIFRQKIDSAVSAFEDLVIARSRWANISPIFAETAEQREDYKEKISTCWHDTFISTWANRSSNTKKDLWDMIMFGKGIEIWETLTDVYPESIPMENCYPESRAGFDPSKWGLFFYTKVFTVNELLLEIEDEKIAELKGWNRDALLDFIRNREAFKTSTRDSILDDFRRGNIGVDSLELEIKLVFAFVKENKETIESDRKGYITHYVMPFDEWTIQGEQEKKESRYFKFFPAYAECMSHHVSVRSYSHSRNYWDSSSFAEEILVTCMTVDKTKNRALRNATRKSSIMVKSQNVDQQEKLSSLSPDEEFTVLDPGMEIQQTSIGSDIRELMEITREISFDAERHGGGHLATGAQNVKGRAITAEEVKQNTSRESASALSDLNNFADQDSLFLKTLYFKTLKAETTDEKILKLRKLFKKKMEEYGIDKEFYDPENVSIESNLAVGAGSPAAKAIIFDKIISFLSFRPSTVGEERAKRDAIASVSSEERAAYYMGPSVETPTNEMQHAGVENAILENSEVNPMNVQVGGDDNHETHLKIHIIDAKKNVSEALEKLKMVSRIPSIMMPTYLDKIHNKIAGAENKATHSLAHIEMIAKDETKKGLSGQMEKEIKVLQQMLAIANSQFKQASEGLLKSQQQNFQLTEEERHMLAMNQEAERHAKAMNDIALAKAVEKTQFGQEQAKVKAMNKQEEHDLAMQQKTKEASLNLAVKTVEKEKELYDDTTSQGQVPQE